MEEQGPVIISPLPIRPTTTPCILDSRYSGQKSEQEEAHAELLAIMAPPHRDMNASPVYRTVNPLPHDTSFTVAAAMISMAVAAAADSDLRPRSYSVGDDRIITC
ncbi:hypothetical protein K492DRAFT_205399 [Lichtheimia hyalospora FSU 10163]|nr:hypothetical protein K492DRAFT_205399 [Lichtheimia hyalospora FSU 10163]